MEHFGIFLACMGLASSVTALSMFLGASIAIKISSQGRDGLFSFPPEPKGEVFTVEDIDDIPFPESGENKAEARIQERAGKFLGIFSGGNK